LINYGEDDNRRLPDDGAHLAARLRDARTMVILSSVTRGAFNHIHGSADRKAMIGEVAMSVVRISQGSSAVDARFPASEYRHGDGTTDAGVCDRRSRLCGMKRRREGIAKAQREGKYRGRAPTVLRWADEIIRLKESGVSPTEIATRLGIGRASVYRVLTDRPGGEQVAA